MMTYKEYREHQRKMEVAHLGPGTYIKNKPEFGKNAQNVKITPPS